MASFPNTSAIAGLIALILVFITTVPTFLSFFNKAKSKANGDRYEDLHKFYEDRDGVATEESQKAFSVAIPKYIGFSSCVVGFLASIIIAVFTTIQTTRNSHVENWLIFGSWVRTKPIPLRSRC